MPNADMNRLMDNARIKLPGALDNTIQLELFSTLDEFFQSTNIWVEDIEFAVTVTSDTYLSNPDAYTYELQTITGGLINRLTGVVNSDGFPQAASMPIPGYVILAYSPNQNDTYTARVTKTITDPVTRDGYPVFPDWILNKYGTDILDGVIGRMMAQIAKPYSSPNIAMAHLRRFQQAVGKARAEVMHGNVYSGQNWSFPQSFASRQYKRF
jgi:hypothetical protein